MSVVEFVALITRRQLVFRQFKGLERSDRLEGKIPGGFWAAFERDIRKTGASREEIQEIRRRAEVTLERLRCFRYVSCWTMAKRENALLWQVYAPHGVAIRTQVGKLREASLVSPDISIRSTGMHYADDWTELQAQGFQHYGVVPNRLFLHTKRTLFVGENEVRFYIDSPAQYEIDAAGIQVAEKAPAWYPIEFTSLSWIEEIIADSSLPDWGSDTLSDLIKPHRLKFRQSGR